MIAAGAVVTKNTPPYAIVAGIPAKVIRYRFDESTRSELEKIRWTEWSDEKIRENLDLFYDPITFIEKYRNEV